jgi:flagellar biosynthesis GTPase FlhF
MSMPDNRAAVRGHNDPPKVAQDVTDRMAADYGELSRTVTTYLDEARALPGAVESESDLRMFSDVVVRLRDTAARAESSRKAEKEPYFRAGQAVDGFFSNLVERLSKTEAVLKQRCNVYQQRKLEEERAARQRARLEAERLEREAAARAAEEARVARAKQDAADRARKDIEEKQVAADEQAVVADSANIDALMRRDDADAARLATLKKSADLTRSRFDEGRIATMRQVGYAEVMDKMALDHEKLWAFVSDDAAAKALRAWAKTTGYKQQMDGAVIGFRDETVIR